MTPAEHQETQQPTLKAFLDNEISWWQQFAVRLHLVRCASCREELQAMQQIGKELRGQTTLDPLDPGLRARILATVQEMTPEPTAPARSRRPVLIWGGTAIAALLLVAVFVAHPPFAPDVSRGAMHDAFAPNPAASTPVPLDYAPREADKSAGERAPSAATAPAKPMAGGSFSGPSEYSPKFPHMPAPEMQAKKEIGPKTTSPSEAGDTPSILRSAHGSGMAGSRVAEAKRAMLVPMGKARAAAPQSITSDMLSPNSPGRREGGFQRRQEGPADTLARDKAGSSQEAVVLERAAFDREGYQFVTQSGQKIFVPFRKSLNAVRFTRSVDGKMALDRAAQSPVLSLGSADKLINDAVPGARWQPLPPSFNSTMPIYVRPAPDWEQFLAMRWYPNMTVVGGLYSLDAADSAFTWLSGSHIQIGATLYPDFAAYRAFADAHPDSLRLRTVYGSADASLPATSSTLPVKSTPTPGVPPATPQKPAGRGGGKPSP